MKNQNILLDGINIYHDKQGRPVYYNRSQKRGYRISKNQETSFKTYYSRFILTVLVFIFMYILFRLNIWISIAISLVAYIFLEYKFRKLLSNCVIIENYEPHKEIKTAMSTKTPMSGLVLRFILYMASGVLLIVNAYVSEGVKNDNVVLSLSWIVGIAAIFFSLKYLEVIFKKRNAQ